MNIRKKQERNMISPRYSYKSCIDKTSRLNKQHRSICKIVICLILLGGISGTVIYRNKSLNNNQSNIDGNTGEDISLLTDVEETTGEEISLLSDSEEEQNKTDEEIDNYLKVKSEYYNSNGDYTGKWIYDYNSNYNLSSINTYTKDDELESSLQYEYDYDGNIIIEKSYMYYSDQTEETDTIYTYENNRLMQYYEQKINGEDAGYHVLEYGDSSYAIKETYYDSAGNVSSWNEYEYDNSGNNIKDTYWIEDRKQGYRLCAETTNEYDKNNYLIHTEKNAYDDKGIIYESERQMYDYDEYGNVVKNMIYRNDELSTTYRWEYIYNESGLIETRKYYINDKLSWVEENEYLIR